jgi:hypothetical protein
LRARTGTVRILSGVSADGVRVAFELDRFEVTGEDRLEVAGRWFGVRGMRFVRPSLMVRTDGGERSLLASLEHKPWAAEEGRTWVAVFPWPGGSPDPGQAELAVAPTVVVDLATASGSTTADQARASKTETTRERLAAEKQRSHRLETEVAWLRDERVQLIAGERAALADRDAALADRDAALADRDAAAAAREAANGEREAAIVERDTVVDQLDAATGRLGATLEELDAARRERDEAVEAREAAVRERDGAVDERTQAEDALAAATRERDQAVLRREEETRSRREASTERDVALRERDAAAHARNSAIRERDELRQSLAAAIRERDDARRAVGELERRRDSADREREGGSGPPATASSAPERDPRILAQSRPPIVYPPRSRYAGLRPQGAGAPSGARRTADWVARIALVVAFVALVLLALALLRVF